MEYLAVALTGIGAAVLGTGGIAKAIDRDSFTRAVETSPLTKGWPVFVAAVVPVVEVFLALLLLLATDLVVVAGIAGAFFAALAGVSWTIKTDECGCGPFVPRRAPLRLTADVGLAIGMIVVALTTAEVARPERLVAAMSFVVVALVARILVAALEAMYASSRIALAWLRLSRATR